jgi:hypothetical protein
LNFVFLNYNEMETIPFDASKIIFDFLDYKSVFVMIQVTRRLKDIGVELFGKNICYLQECLQPVIAKISDDKLVPFLNLLLENRPQKPLSFEEVVPKLKYIDLIFLEFAACNNAHKFLALSQLFLRRNACGSFFYDIIHGTKTKDQILKNNVFTNCKRPIDVITKYFLEGDEKNMGKYLRSYVTTQLASSIGITHTKLEQIMFLMILDDVNIIPNNKCHNFSELIQALSFGCQRDMIREIVTNDERVVSPFERFLETLIYLNEATA